MAQDFPYCCENPKETSVVGQFTGISWPQIFYTDMKIQWKLIRWIVNRYFMAQDFQYCCESHELHIL